MQLEFHQLDQPWAHLRVRHPGRQRRLVASLAEAGQQTPIVVVAAPGQPERYVVIDGYQRLAALRQLGQDTVEAVVWPLSESEAVLLDRSARLAEPESALEVGWLLAELAKRFGYGREELARRFDRSVSWVARRLALVEVLPEAIQQLVRQGQVTAPMALRYLVPVVRHSAPDGQRMAAIFAQHHCDARQAGQLYTAWRRGSATVRQRLLADPALFFKTQREQEPAPGLLRDLQIIAALVQRLERRAAATELSGPERQAARHQLARLAKQLHQLGETIVSPQEPLYVESCPTNHDFGTAPAGGEQARDRASAGDLPPLGAPRVERQLERSAGAVARPQGHAVPRPDPRVVQPVQGEPRASP